MKVKKGNGYLGGSHIHTSDYHEDKSFKPHTKNPPQLQILVIMYRIGKVLK